MTDGFEVSERRSVPPAEAFSLLGNELRVTILLELGDAKEGSQPRPLPFEELRRRCDVSDSGRFNYHLQELLGVFVQEKAEGYGLLYPGVILYQAIKADSFTDRTTVEPFPVDADCADCGAGLEATYRNSMLVVRCGDCGALAFKYHLPPGAIRSNDPDAVLSAANVYARRDLMTVASDVCPTCASEMYHDVVPEEEKSSELEQAMPGPAVVHHCSYCKHFFCTDLPEILIYHPDVLPFVAANAPDLLTDSLWSVDACDPGDIAVDGHDPLRVTLPLRAGDERLDVTVDRSLSALTIERR
ncbi:helix-turn-helix transcriptional regulator [Halosimplex pelagicum]|uniref:Helix-turn-helix transcriptional regulator n=1 Tax=Halosimplex pelagicum TaxID=869886 RepID=A0A7D5PA72_9EURY|nr:helix-turn-helix transcriptional regulator [Halosimplex pelagicum]QLH84577.1 helix-turn-helix transcriptional regulator [Halosimplex pelagicum]